MEYYEIFDPAVGLSLRVDEEWPAARILDDDSVLDAKVVLGQTGDLPAAYLDRITQCVCQQAVLVVWDAQLVAFLNPAVHHLRPILTLHAPPVRQSVSRFVARIIIYTLASCVEKRSVVLDRILLAKSIADKELNLNEKLRNKSRQAIRMLRHLSSEQSSISSGRLSP